MSAQDLEQKKQRDFYQKMRDTIRAWLNNKGVDYKFAEYLLAAPDLFHLLGKLALDKEVPASEKAKLAGAIAYFMSPIDLIPEALTGPVGYVDDIVVAAIVLNSFVNNTNAEMVTRHWAGDKDVLELIQQILQVAEEMVGSGLWQKILKSFGKSK